MYRSLFPGEVFAELDRLQQQMQQAFELSSPSIRGASRGYPSLNVGHTPEAIEVYAFAPGIDPARVEVTLDRGVLSIAGERPATLGHGESQGSVHIRERFAGRFRRTVSLPEDIDPDAVSADYRDGVLRVSVKRRASSQPRRIEVQ